MPEFVGGSADLAPSNNTHIDGGLSVSDRDFGGRNLHFGIREHAMGAIANGLALGGFRPYAATFLVFSDYMRGAVRLSALMNLPVTYVWTHDSIGLGEDGPTHQSVEHVASLRLIPNMDVWRPCDTVESTVAWIAAVERSDGPTSLLFSRQNLNFNQRSTAQIADVARGGYVLSDVPNARAVIIATGSEVTLALEAQKLLAAENIAVRVVSMPSTNVFDRQDAAYRANVLPKGVPRVAVEAGVSDFWRKYVGLEGAVVGIDRYGESAPAGELFKYFGFTAANITSVVKNIL